jgi:transposase
MAVPAGGVFDRHAELVACLQAGPGEAARQEAGHTAPAGPPPRWRLRTIRASLPWLAGYSLSGVWRVMRRGKLRLRSARVQHYSPDPAYAPKVQTLLAGLQWAARQPERVTLVFLDEMGYHRWPAPAPDWTPASPTPAPQALRGGPNNQQWRIIGALNAVTGQTTYADGYIAGRKQLIAFYRRLAATYPAADVIYVVQDNWSIHKHPDVLAAVAALGRIELIWLPTYAPWLNPIEKLWRWLREAVLKLHRLADDWKGLRQRVQGFLDQFATGSEDLLRYVGLQGAGQLAQALKAA